MTTATASTCRLERNEQPPATHKGDYIELSYAYLAIENTLKVHQMCEYMIDTHLVVVTSHNRWFGRHSSLIYFFTERDVELAPDETLPSRHISQTADV